MGSRHKVQGGGGANTFPADDSGCHVEEAVGVSEWRQGAQKGAFAALQVRERGDLHQRGSNGGGTMGGLYLKMALTGFADGVDVRVTEGSRGPPRSLVW